MRTNDDLSFLKIQRQPDIANLHSEYKKIAKLLFEQFFLVVNGTVRFTLVEIEFYLLALWHQDYFTYGYPDQKVFGEWFKHPAGMDLTFGDQKKNEGVYAGILLRGIREVEGKRDFINGSINVRDALSNKNSKVTTEELRDTVGLYRSEKPTIKDIFVSNRIGLTGNSFLEHQNRIISKDSLFKGQGNSKPESFIDRNYRFITDVCPKNKFKEKIAVAKNSKNLNGLTPEYINRLYTWNVIKD